MTSENNDSLIMKKHVFKSPGAVNEATSKAGGWLWGLYSHYVQVIVSLRCCAF